MQTNQEVLKITPENYKVPKGEEAFYHLKIEVKKFHGETGERISKPRIQKVKPKTFKQGGVEHNLKRQGYTIEILHDPTKWLAENAEKVAEQQKENQALKQLQQALANQQAINDAVKAALAERDKENQKAIDKAVAEALAKQPKAEPNNKGKAQ